MKAPQRWLEDPTASAELKRELSRLEAARVSYDTEAGWAALQGVLDESVAGLAGSAAATGAPSSLVPLLSKLVLLAAIGGGAIATVAWLGTERGPAPRASTPSSPASVAATAAVPATPPKSPVASAPIVAVMEPTALEEAKPAVPDSRREIAQLMRIRTLLKRDPAAAHRAIVDAQREFPDGLLREEREGLDAIALARSGERTRARQQAERFIERYPKSPLRPRLERLLAGDLQ
jgi:hypothetical protein